MSAIPIVSRSELTSIAPQFLVDDLEKALTYYRDALGFSVDFIYESFYAGVRRGNASIHLKCAPKIKDDRAHRKQNEHLDVHIEVSGVDALFAELQARGAKVLRGLEQRPWDCKDFYVEDLDGYILAFSEQTD
jgi:uncharacterized glyoxalase superfamily protein PhnB